MIHEEAIHKAVAAMEAARKKLTAKNSAAETAYAEAYAQLCRLDPVTYRPLRKKYRRG